MTLDEHRSDQYPELPHRGIDVEAAEMDRSCAIGSSVAPSAVDTTDDANSAPKARSGVLEALALVCVAFALALTLKTYVAEAYEIKGKSMEPSFSNGQRVVVLKAFYAVDRQDVVVFSSTEDPAKDLIKRVIGLPGETVSIRRGRVHIDGELLDETYVEFIGSDAREELVPEDRYYVLGDNRPDSHDSRYFHAIPRENIKGEVIMRWWPVGTFRVFDSD